MPTVGTFFLAEDLREEGNGRFTAVGIFAGDSKFDTLEDAAFDRLVAFLTVHDVAEGDHVLSLDIDYLSASRTLKVGSQDLSMTSPTDITFVAKIEGFSFPGAGDYRVNCKFDDVKIGHVDFSILIDETLDGSKGGS